MGLNAVATAADAGKAAPAPRIADLIRCAEADLQEAGIDTARLDAELLLAAAARTNRTNLYARLQDRPADAGAAQRFRSAVARRRRREPLAYITGVREFWSLRFRVTPAVLIPRPETETLVEAALDHMKQVPRPAIAEVGTGSGCVAVALARERADAQIIATDISPDALRVARDNSALHGVERRLLLTCNNFLDGIDPRLRFDLVVSNPPYVRRDEVLPPELAWEPAPALTAGPDGLTVVRPLITAAAKRLRSGGWLVMESGAGQERTVRQLAAAAGFQSVSYRRDLSGTARVLQACRP